MAGKNPKPEKKGAPKTAITNPEKHPENTTPGIQRRNAALEANKWKPGQSGNPAGRPKSGYAVSEIFRARLLNEEMMVNGVRKTKLDALFDILMAQSSKGNVMAARVILERAFGMPEQTIDFANKKAAVTFYLPMEKEQEIAVNEVQAIKKEADEVLETIDRENAGKPDEP